MTKGLLGRVKWIASIKGNWIGKSFLLDTMTQKERAGIFRIASDMIKADAVIDMRELNILKEIRDRYNISRGDEILSFSMTMEEAFEVLYETDETMLNDLLTLFVEIAMADDFCAKSEALLLLAMKYRLTLPDSYFSKVVSIKQTEYDFELEPNQLLYVEKEFNHEINWKINEKFREIVTEIRLAGLDFVYMPQIAEYYRSIDKEKLLGIVSFLHPQGSDIKLASIVNKITKITTSVFCMDHILSRLNSQIATDIHPSLMLNIGTSLVENKAYNNFLVINLGDDVLSCVRKLVDCIKCYYKSPSLSYITQERGRLVYAGFHKQLIDSLILDKDVRSKVLVDIFNQEIVLVDIGQIIKLHRKEKALYALFLLESIGYGINFTQPCGIGQFNRYSQRLNSVQEKYKRIYKKFGGDYDKAPDIRISEIRLPMISNIKKSLDKFQGQIRNLEYYKITRNQYGNYGIGLSPSFILCAEKIVREQEGRKIVEIHNTALKDASGWQDIAAL